MKRSHVAMLAGAAALSAAAIVVSQGPLQPKASLPPLSRLVQIPSQKIGEIRLMGGDPHTAFSSSQTQMFAAGRNKFSLLSEDGKVTKSFDTNVENPTIAPMGEGRAVIGDKSKGILIGLNLANGQSSPLFSLSELKDPNAQEVPNAGMMGDGQFSAVASDGKNVFVAFEAGFSSMIFKVDPATKTIVGRGFAACPDPSAMNYNDGQLFVMASEGSKVLRFNDGLVKTYDNIDLPTKGNFGIGLKGGELRTLGAGKTQISRIKVDPKAMTRTSLASVIDRLRLATVIDIGIVFPPINIPKRYAVLICGDLAENFAGECFWNDTVWMYKTLLANKYQKQDIFVLYGDGADYLSANLAYRHPTKVTNWAATAPNVRMVFDGLRLGNAAKGLPKMDSNDSLFLWTFDHGGRSGSTSTLGLRGGAMLATEFAAKANAITYGSRAVFMQQCYSGGFIPLMQNAKTYIATACTATEVARPCDNRNKAGAAIVENETVAGRNYSHGEFNYYITSALNRLRPTPPGGLVNADTNADTFISALEMATYEKAQESLPELPSAGGAIGVGANFKMKK